MDTQQTKNCMHCNTQFTTTNKTGVEQKYCSTNCRMKAANERRFDNFKNKILSENNQTKIEEGNHYHIHSKPIGNDSNNDTFQSSNRTEQLFRELERTKHENELQKVRHQYELAFKEMHDKTMQLAKKMDELEEDQDEPEQEDFNVGKLGQIGMMILNTKFGEELAKNEKVIGLITSLLSKQQAV
jgi:hypothetical protein